MQFFRQFSIVTNFSDSFIVRCVDDINKSCETVFFASAFFLASFFLTCEKPIYW